MAAAPHFTIVVATFGRGAHIVPTLQSALAQRFADFELLVVADGVTDDTLDHVPRDDPRLRIIELTENSGSQSAPNNAGIAAARGRYVAYLGHDDIWMPHHLAALADLFATTGCDVAVSGCVYHGPPTSGVIQVTGLFEHSDAARQHFFPPSSFAHRAALATEIGGWHAPGALAAPVDADFLLRAAAAGARFASTGEVTVHKFAAGHRYLSYLESSSEEQRDMLAAIRSGRVDRQSCEELIARAKADGTFMTVTYPDFRLFPHGLLYRSNRSNKGIDRAPLQALVKEVRVPVSAEPRALDWYAIENAGEGLIAFRWSGPSLRPKILIPFCGGIEARITLHLLDQDPLGVISQTRLLFNNAAIGHRITDIGLGRVGIEFCARLPTDTHSIVEMIVPQAFVPRDIGRGPDRRRLGVALLGYTIAPAARESSQRQLLPIWLRQIIDAISVSARKQRSRWPAK